MNVGYMSRRQQPNDTKQNKTQLWGGKGGCCSRNPEVLNLRKFKTWHPEIWKKIFGSRKDQSWNPENPEILSLKHLIPESQYRSILSSTFHIYLPPTKKMFINHQLGNGQFTIISISTRPSKTSSWIHRHSSDAKKTIFILCYTVILILVNYSCRSFSIEGEGRRGPDREIPGLKTWNPEV